MDEARQAAFRRLLYAAMLDFRANTPVHPYETFARVWRWPAAIRRLKETQIRADWLHNLAQHAAEPGLLDQFDEKWFWGECRRMVERWPALAVRLSFYRMLFEQDFDPDGRRVKAREWGEPARQSSL